MSAYDFFVGALAITGAFVWALIGVSLIVVIFGSVLPALGRWAAYFAYSAFSDVETKRAIRRRAEQIAKDTP